MTTFNVKQQPFLLSFAAICLTACSTTPVETHKTEYQISFGIATKQRQEPPVLTKRTHVFFMDPKGTLPNIAADVKRSIDAPFLLSYVVYRNIPNTGQYTETERSEVWTIRGHDGQLPEAFIGPDFYAGAKPGQYRLDIFIDQSLYQAISFTIVQH